LVEVALVESDEIKERLRYHTELLKLFAVLAIATGGGISTLLLGKMEYARHYVLVAGGMIIVVICVRMIYIKNQVIQNLLSNGK
jgi:hypothetical protein